MTWVIKQDDHYLGDFRLMVGTFNSAWHRDQRKAFRFRHRGDAHTMAMLVCWACSGVPGTSVVRLVPKKVKR